MTAKEVVRAFWQAMQSNDFEHASQWLTDDFENYAPQSSEVVTGRSNFAMLNSHYPAQGKWTFTLNSIVAEGVQVVTDVSVSDGTVAARAITFHTVEHNLIRRQTEFWPDDYPAPTWRGEWVALENRGRCNEIPASTTD